MTALATSPAEIDLYLHEQIADELMLSKLLGFTVTPPAEITPNVTIWGSKGYTFAGSHGPATVRAAKEWMPKWRRSNDCAELIGRCKLTISPGPTGVSVNDWTGAHSCATVYMDHPTEDDAIRYLMCKVAIAYLTSERAARPT